MHGSGFGIDEVLDMAVFLLFQHGIINTPFYTYTFIQHSRIKISEEKCKLLAKGPVGQEMRKMIIQSLLH